MAAKTCDCCDGSIKGIPVFCGTCHDEDLENLQREIINLKAKLAGTDFDTIVTQIRARYLPHCR